MKQLELFPLTLIELACGLGFALKEREDALRIMLEEVDDAHAKYVSRTDGMYADHVVFTDGDTPTFTIIPQFWPDLACDYMDEAHPTMFSRMDAC